jgi:uncharacterized SAM-binding protein YcdF (DUF218 family)
LGIATLGALIAAGVPASRHSLLRSVGWALVAQDAPAKADVIVIAVDAKGAGILEAAGLLRAGFAPRIAIFDPPITQVQREFARRGVEYVEPGISSIQLLRALGIGDIAVIPAADGTVEEGRVLQQWCAANSVHSMLFVSVADHSRRTRRVLDRALGRHGVSVRVRYSRYSEFDPDSWWLTRGGQRIQAVESEKLLLDLLSHPF